MSKKKIINPIDTYKQSNNTLKGGSWVTLKGRSMKTSHRSLYSTRSSIIGFIICLKKKIIKS